MSSINICQLFKTSTNVEGGVSLVETPLTFVGSNDNIVVRVRSRPDGKFLVDDGGDTDWFITTSGYDLESNSLAHLISQQAELASVSLSEDNYIYSIASEPEVPLAVIRVAQVAATLHSASVFRTPKASNTFRDELREIILSLSDSFEISEQAVVPDTHGQIADYKICRGKTEPIYVVAASDKARILEAELIGLQVRQSGVGSVLLIAESQSKVGQKEYERASYYVKQAVVFDKDALPDYLRYN